MDLKTYCDTQHGAQTRVANLIGAQPQLIWQWVAGRRPVPIERCVAIERATGGAVMRWDLRPNDWRDIWPELADRADAPAVSGGVRVDAMSALITGSSAEPVTAEARAAA